MNNIEKRYDAHELDIRLDITMLYAFTLFNITYYYYVI